MIHNSKPKGGTYGGGSQLGGVGANCDDWIWDLVETKIMHKNKTQGKIGF